MSIWSEIRYTHFDEEARKLYLDAFVTEDENESGKVIASISFGTLDVAYLDERAKDDHYAQEIIKEALEWMVTMGSNPTYEKIIARGRS